MSIELFFNKDSLVRVSCWVEFRNDLLFLHDDFQQGLDEVWIDFRRMTHDMFFLMESICVKEVTGYNEKDLLYVYDNLKLKEFILKRMVCDWCFDKPLYFDQHGVLSAESYQTLLSLHPLILRRLLNRYDYRLDLSKEEEGKLERDCYMIFDKGTSVSNANDYLSLYLELTSFWEKFGMNYKDVMSLPQPVYDGLRKVLYLENRIVSDKRDQSMKKNSSGNSSRGGNRQSYGF